jgi:hypothetical protein
MNITGNARQRIGGVWSNLLDGGTGNPPQGLPFIIYGSSFNVNADAGMDITECSNQVAILGGSPSGSGGMGPLTYAWNSSISIPDTTLANPTINITDTGTYVLTVSDSVGCMDTDTIVVNMLPLPQAIITPSGPLSICSGDSTVLNAFTSAGYQYLWNTSDSTSNIVTFSGGTYILNVTDSMSCMDADTIVVNILPLPQALITPSGSLGICSGDSVVLNAFTATGYQYLWNTLDSISSIVTFSAGTYILNVTDSMGCAHSDTVTTALYSLPVADITPGSVSICAGDNTTLTTVTDPNYSYLWSTSETTSSISVSSSGPFIVEVTDTTGCINSDTAVVTVNPAPGTGVTQTGTSGENLSANQTGASYQWVDCNNGHSVIGGANSQNYVATANGSYAVVIDLGGCIDTSVCFAVAGLNIDDVIAQSVQVFPNPANDVFYIQLNKNIIIADMIQIHNSLGQLVTTYTTGNETATIYCSEWEPGIYVISIINPLNGHILKKKLIVQ